MRLVHRSSFSREGITLLLKESFIKGHVSLLQKIKVNPILVGSRSIPGREVHGVNLSVQLLPDEIHSLLKSYTIFLHLLIDVRYWNGQTQKLCLTHPLSGGNLRLQLRLRLLVVVRSLDLKVKVRLLLSLVLIAFFFGTACLEIRSLTSEKRITPTVLEGLLLLIDIW
jgi:hypothetical protein